MSEPSYPHRIQVEDAAARIPGPDGRRFATMFSHGSLVVELYQPRRVDPQQPHERDEVYVVLQGNGWFQNGRDRHPFGPGDVLFVPAGVEHRFEEFTDNLTAWVFFYGPEGGEAGRAPSV